MTAPAAFLVSQIARGKLYLYTYLSSHDVPTLGHPGAKTSSGSQDVKQGTKDVLRFCSHATGHREQRLSAWAPAHAP